MAENSKSKDEGVFDGAKQKHNPHAIASIVVEKLFGQYNYDLGSDIKKPTDLSRLMIMYGDNGGGKTTLLKMIYHALSSEEGGGHRSFLARTRFKNFTVTLNDGTVLEIKRQLKTSGGILRNPNKTGG